MPTVGQFFFHDLPAPLTPGSFPSSPLFDAAPDVTAADAATNRPMDGAVGAAGVDVALSTLAQIAAQTNWFRRFLSPRLAAHTIAAGRTITFGLSAREQSLASVLVVECAIYAWSWLAGTGALIGSASAAFASLSAVWHTFSFVSAADAVLDDGDVLVVEIYGTNTQGSATSFSNTIRYDGTQIGIATDPASNVSIGAPIPLLDPTLQGQQDELRSDPSALDVVDRVSVGRGSYFCLGEKWARRGRLWVPSPERALTLA